MSGYISDEINRTVNWDGPRHCTERDCVANSEYMAGSYSSELRHFEDSIGALLPEPLSFARLLILFQDARKADKFELAGPFEDVSSLGADRHRYFCLTHAAWDNLGLGEALGADGPCWPNEQTAWRYLARYLSRAGNSWSYDGFLAYLLYRFRPKDAYITNVAKCYAGSSSKVFRLCAKKHLSLEIERFKPNMIISFTGRAESIGQLGSLARADVSGVRCFMRPLHPAVWNPQRKANSLVAAIEREAEGLAALGCEPATIVADVQDDIDRVLEWTARLRRLADCDRAHAKAGFTSTR